MFSFFFQAEDGIRDGHVTGVQTCALPISIITQVVLGLVHTLGLEQPLDVALETPRIHHQWRPDALFVEKTMPDSIRAVLESKGHELRQLGNYGSTQAIGLDAQGKFFSVAEPRLKERNRTH